MKEKMKDFLKKIKGYFINSDFWNDKKIQIILATNFVFNLIIWVLVIVKLKNSIIPFASPIMKLTHYLFLSGNEVYILPILGLLIFLMNFALSYEVFKREKFLSLMLLGVSLFVQVIILATVIIYLVI